MQDSRAVTCSWLSG